MTNTQLADLLEEAARRLRGTCASPSTGKRMTATELAKELGLHVVTIRNRARLGIIPGVNHGGRKGWSFDRDKVSRALSLKYPLQPLSRNPLCLNG